MLVGLLPFPAAAERGALTVSGGVGAGLVHGPPRYTSPTERAAGGTPALLLSLRYALDHEIEVGASALGLIGARVHHDDVRIEGLPGRLVYDYGLVGLFAELRWVPFGLILRPYVTLQAGVVEQLWVGARHLYVAPDGSTRDYGVEIPDTFSPAPAAGAGGGVEYVWDHLAVGLRGDVAVAAGTVPAVGLGATAYFAWSFFP